MILNKECSVCRLKKEINKFSKMKTGSYHSQCKECRAEKQREYYQKVKNSKGFKEKASQNAKKWYHKNKERVKLNSKTLYLKNKDNPDFIARRKKYRDENKVKLKELKHNWYLNNKEKVKTQKTKWKIDNAEKYKLTTKKYNKRTKYKRYEWIREKRKTDSDFKFLMNLRRRVLATIQEGGYTKRSKLYDILGCSFDEFKIHIENQFVEGMSWSNRDLWHLDHIIPVSSAENEFEIVALNHYVNFQPLWADENIKKKDKFIKSEKEKYIQWYTEKFNK